MKLFVHQFPLPPGQDSQELQRVEIGFAEDFRLVSWVDNYGYYPALTGPDPDYYVAGGLLGLPYTGDLGRAGGRAIYDLPQSGYRYVLVATRSEGRPVPIALRDPSLPVDAPPEARITGVELATPERRYARQVGEEYAQYFVTWKDVQPGASRPYQVVYKFPIGTAVDGPVVGMTLDEVKRTAFYDGIGPNAFPTGPGMSV